MFAGGAVVVRGPTLRLSLNLWCMIIPQPTCRAHPATHEHPASSVSHGGTAVVQTCFVSERTHACATCAVFSLVHRSVSPADTNTTGFFVPFSMAGTRRCLHPHKSTHLHLSTASTHCRRQRPVDASLLWHACMFFLRLHLLEPAQLIRRCFATKWHPHTLGASGPAQQRLHTGTGSHTHRREFQPAGLGRLNTKTHSPTRTERPMPNVWRCGMVVAMSVLVSGGLWPSDLMHDSGKETGLGPPRPRLLCDDTGTMPATRAAQPLCFLLLFRLVVAAWVDHYARACRGEEGQQA